jgi:Dolichyl-phosphate-mannose-protein mannosyltransferase
LSILRARPWRSVLPILVLAGMGLIIAYPLLQPAMLCGDDFPTHLSHAVELDRLWSDRVWYPRWAPDFSFGYGSPAFDFYPPLPRYLSVLIHRLGLPLSAAVNLTAALALLIAGPAMFLLARSIYGDRAGLVAGLAYTFAPYLADDTLQRLAINEALAMSLMPLVLWAFGRLGDSDRLQPGRVVAAALVCATLVLTHSLMTLMFIPLLAGYLFVLWWVRGRPGAHIGNSALAGLLALGLTAFFWLPFIVQVQWVQMWRAQVWDLTGELLYPLHFSDLRSLLWPDMLWPDYTINNPLLQRMLGLPQMVLSVLALALAWRLPSRLARAATILFGIALAVSVFLTTRASRPVWDNLSALQMVQFPWRFLTLASLASALLAGAAAAGLRFRPGSPAVAWALNVALVALLAAWTLPWVRPFNCTIETNPSASFLVWVDGKTSGGGSTGEYLPVWAQDVPGDSPLEADLLAGRPLDRLDRSSLPEGAQAALVFSRSLTSRWQVTSPKAFTASFHSFYFPGWSVRVDNELAPISPAPLTGLIQASLPAGKHTVSLSMDSTQEQVLGSVISLVTAAAALAQCSVSAIRRGARLPASQAGGPDGVSVLPRWEWAALGIVGIAALAARLVLYSLAPPAVPAGPAIPSTASRVSIQVGDHIRLIGYEFSPPAVRAGESLTVTLYWQTDSLLMNSYKSFVHVIDVNGQLAAQSDAVPGDWTRPTSIWLPGEWTGDPHALEIPAGAPGPLTLWAGMYDPATLQRLNIPEGEAGRIRLGFVRP